MSHNIDFRSRRHPRQFVALLVAGCALAALTVAGQAQAQAVAPAPDQTPAPSADQAAPPASGQIADIVVTALRRTENLQTTGVAATVLDTAALNRKGALNMQDLQTAAPALSMTASNVVSNVNIRGIGLNNTSPQVVPGVAMYRDGLWQPAVASGTAFYDLASVEVLRGPQGTFVGSNSTGGAIFLNSRNPDLNGGVSGNVQALVGNKLDLGLNGAVNLPISQTLAARVAFNVERRDSFYRNVNPTVGYKGAGFPTPGSLDEKDARVSLLWEPTSTLKFVLKSDYSEIKNGGLAQKPIPTTAYYPFAPKEPFDLNFDQYTQGNTTTTRNSLETKWQPSPGGITIRSVTGFQKITIRGVFDTDSTNATLPVAPARSQFQHIDEKAFTQEISLLSPTGGRFDWIAGAFYLHDVRTVLQDFRSETFPVHQYLNLHTTLDAKAVFGQVGYELVPGLQVQLGARYTHTRVHAPVGDYIDVGPGVILIPASGEHKEDVWTGKLALNWTLDKNNFLYAFAAKGTKAGGFNLGAPPVQFSPETVWDYELGWKSYLLDRHLRIQLGGFWNNYKNLQFGVVDTRNGANAVTNVGKSTIKGVEAQAEATFGNLRLDGSVGYVNSRLGAITLVNSRLLPGGGAFNVGPQCATGQTTNCFDYGPAIVSVSGKPNPYSPEWTFNAGIEYGFDLGHGATLTPRVNVAYLGTQWTNLIQSSTATDLLPAFTLWNASLTLVAGDWTVQAFGRNITDKLYVTGQGGNSQYYGNPRQYGMTVARRF